MTIWEIKLERIEAIVREELPILREQISAMLARMNGAEKEGLRELVRIFTTNALTAFTRNPASHLFSRV